MTKLSLLDLSIITEGSSAADAFANSLDLARKAETWGYHRYWVAEHHNLPGIASAATAVVIGHLAGGTTTLRVGAGGIMLPNHSPLIIAEQFGTLESLFPGRIDLGLGRAPGTDPSTARALRRAAQGAEDEFPNDVMELQSYFSPVADDRRIRAVPGAGLNVPIWILGSSLYGASLAAAFGLPYAFASHFAPAALMPAIELYRQRFTPSPALSTPYVMLGFNVFAADSLAEARYLKSSSQRSILALRRGQSIPVPAPVEDFEANLGPVEHQVLAEAHHCSATGTQENVTQRLREFIAQTQADEVMISCQMFDHAARVRSFEITAKAHAALTQAETTTSAGATP